jgi:hypothetical protein
MHISTSWRWRTRHTSSRNFLHVVVTVPPLKGDLGSRLVPPAREAHERRGNDVEGGGRAFNAASVTDLQYYPAADLAR